MKILHYEEEYIISRKGMYNFKSPINEGFIFCGIKELLYVKEIIDDDL